MVLFFFIKGFKYNKERERENDNKRGEKNQYFCQATIRDFN